MISEPQAKRLLTEIEEGTGRSLPNLRKDLLRNRIPEAAIWELIVLYVAFRAFGDVEHEPGVGLPDVLIAGLALSLEAHVVFSKSEADRRSLNDFERWMLAQISRAGIKIETTRMKTELIDANRGVDLRERQYWSELKKNPDWSAFLESLRLKGGGTWVVSDCNVRIILKLTTADYSTGGAFVPPVSKELKSHPLYTAIRRKSRQIKKWNDRVLSEPVVLVIGAFEQGIEFDDGAFGGQGNRDQVIWSSLIDPSDIDPLDAYNIMGADLKITEGGLKPTGKSYRVSGSKNIGAIVFVQFRTTLDRHSCNREADAKIYVNPKANQPLSELQLNALERMDFSVVEYGPGWESWQGATRDSMRDRNLKRGGGWQLESLEGGGFALEIPAIAMAQVMSGLLTAEHVLGGSSDGLDAQTFLARTLEENRELIGAQLIEPESQREERRVKLEFGPAEQALISRAKEK